MLWIIKDIDMVEIFKLGGIEVTKEEVVDMLNKNKENVPSMKLENADVVEDDYVLTCDMLMLESIFKWIYYFKKRKARSETRATSWTSDAFTE